MIERWLDTASPYAIAKSNASGFTTNPVLQRGWCGPDGDITYDEWEHRVVEASNGRWLSLEVQSGTLADLAGNGAIRVRVRTPRREALVAALEASGGSNPPTGLDPTGPDELLVTGLTPSDIGRRAFLAGVELHELAQQTNDLESLFLELTATGTPGGTA